MPKVQVEATEVEADSLHEALRALARKFGDAADQAEGGVMPEVEGATLEGEPNDPTPSTTLANAIVTQVNEAVASGEIEDTAEARDALMEAIDSGEVAVVMPGPVDVPVDESPVEV